MSLLKHKQTVHTHTHTHKRYNDKTFKIHFILVFGCCFSILTLFRSDCQYRWSLCVCFIRAFYHFSSVWFLCSPKIFSFFEAKISGSSATQKLKIQSTNKNLLSFGPKLSGSSSSRSAVGKTFLQHRLFFGVSVFLQCVVNFQIIF